MFSSSFPRRSTGNEIGLNFEDGAAQTTKQDFVAGVEHGQRNETGWDFEDGAQTTK